MKIPVINNTNIMIREVKKEDLSEIAEVYGSSAESFSDLPFQNSRCHILVICKESVIGVISLTEKGLDEAEIGYRIHPDYRRQKIAKDAVYLLSAFLHENGIRLIHAKTKEENTASVRILEHNGYELVRKENGIRYYIHSAKTMRQMGKDNMKQNGIVLAGGCFWGMEKALRQLHGVLDTKTGYANGNGTQPTYEVVCRNDTGYKEAVYVAYDPEILPLETLMKAYFFCIDPTVKNRQGNDVGTQYQTGVYYLEEEDGRALEHIFAEERKKHPVFYTELEPLQSFWYAEEYHQNYLEKHPEGYCHISRKEMEYIKVLNGENI